MYSRCPAEMRERRLLRTGRILSLCTLVPLIALGVPVLSAIVISFVPVWLAQWIAYGDRPFSAIAITVLLFTGSMIVGLEVVPRLLSQALEPWQAWLTGGAVAALLLLQGIRWLGRYTGHAMGVLPRAAQWQRAAFVVIWVGFWAVIGPASSRQW